MSFDIPSSKISLDNIKNYIEKTPLKHSERLSKETNSNIFLKLEKSLMLKFFRPFITIFLFRFLNGI